MRVLHYCQHVLGIGHLFRSLAICRALAPHPVVLVITMDAGGNDVWFGSDESSRKPELTVTAEEVETNEPPAVGFLAPLRGTTYAAGDVIEYTLRQHLALGDDPQLAHERLAQFAKADLVVGLLELVEDRLDPLDGNAQDVGLGQGSVHIPMRAPVVLGAGQLGAGVIIGYPLLPTRDELHRITGNI